MKKRIFSLVACVTLCMSLFSSKVFASELFSSQEISTVSSSENRVFFQGVDITVDINEEIDRAFKGITDLEASSNELVRGNSSADIASARLVDTSGNQIPVEVYTTTREIDVPMSVSSYAGNSGNSTSKIYATTSVAVVAASETSDTNSENEQYVTAYGTIYWIDHTGLDNELVSVSGGWDPDVNPSTGKIQSLSDRHVALEAYDSASDTDIKHYYPTSNAFSYSNPFTSLWFAYYCHTYVDINDSYRFEFQVSTSF